MTKTTRPPVTGKRKWLPILAAVFGALLLCDCLLSWAIYRKNFGRRYECDAPLTLYAEDFPGLSCERFSFPSLRGQTLAGYLYRAGDEEKKGLIVLAHGYGNGGHHAHIDYVNYFAQNGYYVFAYDVTGTDESEGDEVGGLPQGPLDLRAAISFVKDSGQFPDLPIGLFGHSWGGHSVATVLQYHPDVRAVVSSSGFDRSCDMFEIQGRAQVGAAIHLMLPFVKAIERAKYGAAAADTALAGLAASDAPVFFIQGGRDETVPPAYGYDKYYETYKDDPRFRFVFVEDATHDVLHRDSEEVRAFKADLAAWEAGLDYDPKAQADRFAADRAAYIREHLDRSAWSRRVNEDLFQEFLAFFDLHMT